MNRCFISYESHPATRDFAGRVFKSIQSHPGLKKYLDTWFFPEAPDPLGWEDAAKESLFHVIVVSPNYLSSKACKQELKIAMEAQRLKQERFSSNKLITVFGICPESSNIPNGMRSNIYWHQYEAKLCEQMQEQLDHIAPKLTDMKKFTFKDWPHGLLTKNGDLDVAIITGSTGKEASLGDNEEARKKTLKPFYPYLTVEDHIETQSARPGEYLPFLTSSLERLSRNKKMNLKVPNADLNASVPEVYCDRTAVRYYPEILKNRNIITIGGGDTNMFSRYIHRYFKGQLPVHFTSPEDSKELWYTADNEISGPKIKILSTTENKSLFHGLLLILPNPLNQEKFVVWLAGLTGLGTQAGIKILADNPDALREGPHLNARVFKSDDDKKWRAKGYTFL